jgi:DNA polymerase-4
VVLKVRFQDFKTITRSYTSGNLARHSDDLLQAAQVLVGRVPLDGRRIRLVGLGVSNLADEHDEELPREEAGTPQMSLWDSI